MIEIQYNDLSGCTGYRLYDTNRKEFLKRSGMFPYSFYEDDIYELLSKRQYKDFENGKYIFKIPHYKLFCISGNMRYYRSQDAKKIDNYWLQKLKEESKRNKQNNIGK